MLPARSEKTPDAYSAERSPGPPRNRRCAQHEAPTTVARDTSVIAHSLCHHRVTHDGRYPLSAPPSYAATTMQHGAVVASQIFGERVVADLDRVGTPTIKFDPSKALGPPSCAAKRCDNVQ